ncbi:MAG: GNAT family N-acetyltransferase [Novosphingobium sp.]|nr:GNAT family N-acetyltransferase [Novosphingobium sp.]MCE2842493.1 GNAT family N-acetyltransferase [Novosphingobium sp.]
MITVREIEPGDLPGALYLGQLMQAEAPAYQEYPFEDERFEAWFTLCLDNPDWLGLVAVDDVAGIIGFLAMGSAPMIFCSARTADDLAFFVHPQWRGTTAAVRLIRYMEAWAEAKGTVQIRMGLTTGTNTDPARRFLERFGYQLEGLVLVKRN